MAKYSLPNYKVALSTKFEKNGHGFLVHGSSNVQINWNGIVL